jgi:HSP20 family molecular chaperone IbpA
MIRDERYYVIPEHHMRLSDDRSELFFDLHLPRISKEDLDVEVLARSICVKVHSESVSMVSKCFVLPYEIDPQSAVGEFNDHILHVRSRLSESLERGIKLSL